MHDWAEFRHFRYLLVILEKQGFRVAAEELHTSQPNLSVQARKFQENASVRLFWKTKSGRIRPTDAGVAFIALARFVLEAREEAIDTLMAIGRGEIGSVRLGCAPLVDQSIFRSFCGMHKQILPACSIRTTHGDSGQLAEEVMTGALDAAIVTLPIQHPDLHIEELRRDRLVVCLRRDDPLARKAALHTVDLEDNLTILYHPQRHPEAQERLLELLSEVGIEIEEYSRASHPSELQMLVKEGHGLTLIREGIILDDELTTRPIAGVDWTVDTAVIYHKERHPKNVPNLVRRLKKQLNRNPKETGSSLSASKQNSMANRKRPPQSVKSGQGQSALSNEVRRSPRDRTG